MTEKQSVAKSHFLIGWNSSSFVFLRIHIHADHISCVCISTKSETLTQMKITDHVFLVCCIMDIYFMKERQQFQKCLGQKLDFPTFFYNISIVWERSSFSSECLHFRPNSIVQKYSGNKSNFHTVEEVQFFQVFGKIGGKTKSVKNIFFRSTSFRILEKRASL